MIFNQSKRGSIYENGSFNSKGVAPFTRSGKDKSEQQITNNTEFIVPNQTNEVPILEPEEQIRIT